MQQFFKPDICKSYETSKLKRGNDFSNTCSRRADVLPMHQAAFSISQPAADSGDVHYLKTPLMHEIELDSH